MSINWIADSVSQQGSNGDVASRMQTLFEGNYWCLGSVGEGDTNRRFGQALDASMSIIVQMQLQHGGDNSVPTALRT